MGKQKIVTKKFTEKVVKIPQQKSNEDLYIDPQNKEKKVKIVYKKGDFDPKKDSFFVPRGGRKAGNINYSYSAKKRVRNGVFKRSF